MALKPEWAEAHYELGLLYEDEAQDSEAIPEFELAIKPERTSEGSLSSRPAVSEEWPGDACQKEFAAFEALK